MPALLEISGLSVSFAGLRALVDASLRVEPGEIVAVIGPNGAGKTTLLNAISGVVKPDTGSILLEGRPIHGLSASEIARAGIRRTFQNGGLFAELTVLENVLVGLHETISAHPVGLFYPGSAAAREERQATAKALELLATMNMAQHAQQRAGSLSGGQQRIVELVRTVAGRPRLLLLDEPAVGLSPTARLQLTEIVRAMARRDRVGVVLIEHAIDLVMELSDRIVVFSSGTKIADGAPSAVRQDPAVLEAYLGSSLGS